MRTVLKLSEAWEIKQGTVDSHMYSNTLNTKTIFHRTMTTAGRLQYGTVSVVAISNCKGE